MSMPRTVFHDFVEDFTRLPRNSFVGIQQAWEFGEDQLVFRMPNDNCVCFPVSILTEHQHIARRIVQEKIQRKQWRHAS